MWCRPSARWWSLAEGACWTLALIALSAWAALHLAAAVGARYELRRFAVLEAAAQTGTGTPDQSLWSAARIKAWQNAMNDPAPPPLGVLRIPRLQLEATLLAGTEDATLDRGLGHIEDTARPGTNGNSGIAGHRDGFFRVLKDIAEGDTIEIQTLGGKEIYRVERTWIVEPDDVSVLDPTPSRSLTLVTCYPFYFVGSAPQRFIVRAVSVGNTQQ
jgi:sortase A